MNKQTTILVALNYLISKQQLTVPEIQKLIQIVIENESN